MGAPDLPEIPPGDEDAFEVWACNWQSVRAFLSVETQWRAASGLGGLVWLGLDYACVDAALRRLRLPDEVFEDLQVMETEALTVFSETTDDR